MQFTFQRLASQGKTINVSLLPEIDGNSYTWQIDDKDILTYDFDSKQFKLDIYDFNDDEGDWYIVDTLQGNDAKLVAIQNNIIS